MRESSWFSERRQHRSPESARDEGLAGVGEHGNDTMGHTGTWEVLTSPLKNPGGEPGDQDLALHRDSAKEGSNRRVQQRYREAKETKRRGKDGRTSELFIVPMKRENQPEGSRRGKGEPVGGTVGGNDAKDTEP